MAFITFMYDNKDTLYNYIGCGSKWLRSEKKIPAQKKKIAAQEIVNGCAGKKINCAAKKIGCAAIFIRLREG
jgi:hypothetical protein